LLSGISRERFEEARQKPALFDDPDQLRGALLDFIADFADWDNSNVAEFLETSRALTETAHYILGGEQGTRPLVVDPFAGGGAIPLEVLRIGGESFASDINPVAVLLNKVILEYIPKYGQRLADQVRKYGEWIERKAEKELGDFYPKHAGGVTIAAYLWARTIRCEGPGCGTEVPLLGSLWLSRKKKPTAALQLISSKSHHIDLGVVENPACVENGFTKGHKAICPICQFVTPTERVRQQLLQKSGGSSDGRMVAVVTSAGRGDGVRFCAASEQDIAVIAKVKRRLEQVSSLRLQNGLSLIPDEDAPPEGALGYRFQRYGITKWRELYASRQLLALATFTQLVGSNELTDVLKNSLGAELAAVVRSLLSLAVGRLNDRCSTLCRWEPDYLKIQAANGGENKMPMLMDFVEVNPFGGRSGNWKSQISWIVEVIERCAASVPKGVHGVAIQSPAQFQIWSDDMADALVTDPPYYDAFGYSDLSEYFYIWLRRTVGIDVAELFTDASPPKTQEAIAIGKALSDRGLKNQETYLADMLAAFKQARKVVKPSGIACVIFASKSTLAWEAILDALIRAGWVITSSWPIDTEMAHRTRALGSAALNSSIHITCRPREDSEGQSHTEEIGDWRDILRELPRRIHDWMPRLVREGVVGADAIFACLGPGLEIFSRYSRVEKPNGDPVPLKDYLEHVWAAVSREALSTIFEGADTEGFEPDARLTAMWLWTVAGSARKASDNEAVGDKESAEEDEHSLGKKGNKKSGFVLEYDAARKIAQGLGAYLEDLQHVVEVAGETARLLPAAERSAHLFGKDQADVTMVRGKRRPPQLDLFADLAQEGVSEAA
jgi:adenine-specific DNA methylase